MNEGIRAGILPALNLWSASQSSPPLPAHRRFSKPPRMNEGIRAGKMPALLGRAAQDLIANPTEEGGHLARPESLVCFAIVAAPSGASPIQQTGTNERGY